MAWSFKAKTINLMTEAIQESNSAKDLAEAVNGVLVGLLRNRGHETFPDRQLNKDFVNNVSGAFIDKVEEISRLPSENGE